MAERSWIWRAGGASKVMEGREGAAGAGAVMLGRSAVGLGGGSEMVDGVGVGALSSLRIAVEVNWELERG